jgi:thiamine biosynthesis lipoprotein
VVIRQVRRLLLAWSLAWGLAGCGGGSGYLQLEGGTMGTYYRVTARCPDVDADRLARAVAAELERVNEQMSTYRPDSELMRFNASEPGRWQTASRELVEVMSAAVTLSRHSSGAFDVTVSPLVDLWGFGPEGRIDSVPVAETIARVLDDVGWEYLEVDAAGHRLRRTRSVEVDLSAIAKGHGVDRVGAVLNRQGCSDYLVDIGGEVKGRGLNPSGHGWRIGVEVPDSNTMGAVQRVVTLTDLAVATSGDYRNFLDLNGHRYSHTLDPRTGYPVDHDLASVTVLHEQAMWADGLATALNVLGPEAGFTLAEEERIPALFLIRHPDGFEERYTEAMLNHLDDNR